MSVQHRSSESTSANKNLFFCKLSLGPQIASSSRECDGLRGVLPACLLPLTTLSLVFREEEGRGASGIPLSQLASPHALDHATSRSARFRNIR